MHFNKKRSGNINISDKKRMFIAINLDKDIKHLIMNMQEKINGLIKKNVNIKYVDSKNLHISLKFLGDLNSIESEKVSLALKKISFQYNPFDITLTKNIGIFTNRNIPRVIWIGIKTGSNKLKEICSSIEQELINETFLRIEKNFIPHITIGRIKKIKYKDELVKNLKNINFKDSEDIKQNIQSIELMESQLTPNGPIYRLLNKFPFLQ